MTNIFINKSLIFIYNLLVLDQLHGSTKHGLENGAIRWIFQTSLVPRSSYCDKKGLKRSFFARYEKNLYLSQLLSCSLIAYSHLLLLRQ